MTFGPGSKLARPWSPSPCRLAVRRAFSGQLANHSSSLGRTLPASSAHESPAHAAATTAAFALPESTVGPFSGEEPETACCLRTATLTTEASARVEKV